MNLARSLPAAVPFPTWLRRAVAAQSELWTALLVLVPPLAVGLWLLYVGVDPDYWWHLATGQWILAHHRVPFTDPFSWTHASQSWIAHEWLAELILALVYRLGGYAAGLALTGLISVSGYWLLLRAGSLYGLSRRAVFLLLLLWGGIPLPYTLVRPQVWGFALLALLIAELVAYDVGRRRRLWLLPLLFVVWMNINLNAFIGLGCLGVFALDRLMTRRLDRHLLLVCVLCGLAPLVNPRGLDLVRLALQYSEPGTMTHYRYIQEWRPPSPRDPLLIPFWLATPVVAMAGWKLASRWPPLLWPGLLVVIFFEMALRATRYVPVYGLVLLPFAAWLIWQRRQSVVRSDTDSVDRPSLLRLSSALTPLLAAGLILAIASRQSWSHFHRAPDAGGEPAAAAALLQQNWPQARLFNSYNWGGYLIYRLTPGIKVYVDGRNEMYGDRFMAGYFDFEQAKQGWADVISRLDINAALVEPRTPIAVFLAKDPAWRAVYRDDRSDLFIREREEGACVNPSGGSCGSFCTQGGACTAPRPVTCSTAARQAGIC